jgi:hypothetical protein
VIDTIKNACLRVFLTLCVLPPMIVVMGLTGAVAGLLYMVARSTCVGLNYLFGGR